MKRFKDFLFVVGFTAVFVDAPAHAYLDSGTISLVLQGVAGAFASALLFGRAFLDRLKGFFRSKAADSDSSQP